MEIHCAYTVRDANKLLAGLLLVDLGFAAIYALDVALGSPITTLHIQFDLDGEANIPAWFSSIQLLVIALIFLVRAGQVEADDRPSRTFMRLVGLTFVFFSLDEVAAIHEAITVVLTRFEAIPGVRGDHGTWILVYAVIGLALMFGTSRDLAEMWSRYRRPFVIMVIGFVLILAGAVGLEAIGHQYLGNGLAWSPDPVEVALEELLEMSGGSVILYGAALLPLGRS